MYDNMTERPDCSNPNCDNKGIVIFNRRLLCGDCVSKLQEIQRKKEDEEFNKLINDTNGGEGF